MWSSSLSTIGPPVAFDSLLGDWPTLTPRLLLGLLGIAESRGRTGTLRRTLCGLPKNQETTPAGRNVLRGVDEVMREIENALCITKQIILGPGVFAISATATIPPHLQSPGPPSVDDRDDRGGIAAVVLFFDENCSIPGDVPKVKKPELHHGSIFPFPFCTASCLALLRRCSLKCCNMRLLIAPESSVINCLIKKP